MSNITVTHAPAGLVQAAVVRRELVSPHVVRVTLGGAGLEGFQFQGFDQWFRLAVPVHDGDRFDNLPDRFGFSGYLRYLALPRGTRPVIRNYTVRAYRPQPAELDIDFVVHGTDGVAAPWAAAVEPGAPVAIIDQGCGWDPVPAEYHLLVADETGMPAIAGILRDMPRESTGDAVIELFDARDRQELEAPPGMTVHWLERPAQSAPGTAALPAVRDLGPMGAQVYAFAVGESELATGVRRHLVDERGVPKANVTFSGYWKRAVAD